MTDDIVLVFATKWCYDCRRARIFLDRHSIPYRWIDIDHDSDGEQFVKQTNKGYRSVPTIVFPDGRILVEPSDQELETAFLKEETSTE